MERINAGDTAWVLASAALVMLMTPALGFFYGGLVRQKNVLSTLMHSFVALCVISVQWVLWGYTLAFGPDVHHVIGSFAWLGLNGVGATPNADYAPTIPHAAFALFQMMFAVITPALITGGFAERKRFAAFALFTLLWATFVYDPIAHWVWGHGGWLANLGALDFAGGTVVHISSGVAALVCAFVLGPRILHDRMREPHDRPMMLLGASLCWFGWFGFNAGSALAANGVAALAFVNTGAAAAMGGLAWMFLTWWRKGAPTAVGAAAGAIAGLVAITPAAGYVSPSAAILIGAIAAVVCYVAVNLRERMRVDDALDVFPVHGIGGTVGALLTGVFALGANVPKQVLVQLLAVAAVWVYTAIATWIILQFVTRLVAIRVSADEERLGLDVTQHAEVAYARDGGSSQSLYAEHAQGYRDDKVEAA
ncbi:MAG TPA: ammonium transporter [Candidatus Baltobacteraceae bacterium]|nr:ammonium transporter [Candidatus Baltobacteraceae bacterium]